MKIEINYIESVEDVLRSYSGRRLQYAIRMGILPTPEKFSLLLKHQPKTVAKQRKAARKAISCTRQGGQYAT
jgi:hypothetical protein